MSKGTLLCCESSCAKTVPGKFELFTSDQLTNHMATPTPSFKLCVPGYYNNYSICNHQQSTDKFIQTLFGSFMMRYLPSLSLKQMSIIHRSIPQALSMFRLIWLANSVGLNCCVPRITWLAVSFWWFRDTYLQVTVNTM